MTVRYSTRAETIVEYACASCWRTCGDAMKTGLKSGEGIQDVDLTPTVPDSLTLEQRIGLWADLLDACDQLVLAGLRRQIGPDGDLRAAYRAWYAEHMEEHDRMMSHMIERFNARSHGDAG